VKVAIRHYGNVLDNPREMKPGQIGWWDYPDKQKLILRGYGTIVNLESPSEVWEPIPGLGSVSLLTAGSEVVLTIE
jgi:hypothetical protein